MVLLINVMDILFTMLYSILIRLERMARMFPDKNIVVGIKSLCKTF